MPTLRQFRYLVAVADHLNFRRAAEACHVSQPTLSEQIREMELRLKVQLIERSRQRVVLTPIGREVVEKARGVLRDVQDIIDLAESGRHILEGTVRLGILPSLGPYLLPEVLPYLHQRYPNLRLYLREGTTGDILRRLGEGDLDLLIFPIPVKRRGLSAVALFREPLWLALPRSHPLSVKTHLEPADLQDLTVLALEPGHSLHNKVLAFCRDYGATPLLDFATTSLDTLRQMAVMNMGVTFLPALYVRAEAQHDDQLVVRPFRQPGPSRDIGMVWREQSARRAEYVALATHVRDVLTRRVPEVVPLAQNVPLDQK
jgi:LysR family transcriptional regulator, hydrogen peroxide-inducible genes activator